MGYCSHWRQQRPVLVRLQSNKLLLGAQQCDKGQVAGMNASTALKHSTRYVGQLHQHSYQDVRCGTVWLRVVLPVT